MNLTKFSPPAVFALHPLVASLDLEPVKRKLTCPEEGVNWTAEICAIAETEYRRFLTLVLLNPGRKIVPNELIDTFWHHHILHTVLYHRDMNHVFKAYLHHDPTFGVGGPEAKAELQAAFEATKELYYARFGCRMEASLSGRHAEMSDCGSMCASSCRAEVDIAA